MTGKKPRARFSKKTLRTLNEIQQSVEPGDGPPSFDVSGAVELVHNPAGGTKKTIITPEGIELVRRWMAPPPEGWGLNIKSCASKLRIPRQTFQDCVRRQPALALIVDSAKSDQEQFLVDCVYRQAAKGNFLAAKFALESCHGYRTNDAPVTATNNVTIHLPASMTMAQLLEMNAAGVSPRQLAEASPLQIPTEDTIDTEGENA